MKIEREEIHEDRTIDSSSKINCFDKFVTFMQSVFVSEINELEFDSFGWRQKRGI